MLEKLNRFTRREHTEDEVYIFDVILCDNDVDRDYEAFSDNALEKLRELFIGKTGIFDHNPKGSNQTARIFDTEIITVPDKINSYGRPYKQLRASAYMVRTAANSDLIKEIDGGIKKEVSISCSAKKSVCSICKKENCIHVKGRKYGSELCFHTLDDITDAYEWSFVAVPAQVNAGVTKYFGNDSSELINELNQKNQIINTLYDDLKRDVIRLCYLNNSAAASKALEKAVEKMDISELSEFKRSLISENKSKSSPQLANIKTESVSDFKLREAK